MRNRKHCLHKVQQGQSNSEYPLMRTCISHKEYSQAMPRDRSRKSLCRRDRCTIRDPREHPQMVTPLSKEGLGSCACRSNPIDLGLVKSISHHGDTATLKEIDFRVTANPGFERNIPR